MWANHDVKYNYWNVHRYKDDRDILWNTSVNWGNYKIIDNRVIIQYFKRPNYLKINGEPLFSIFSVNKLVESFRGNLEETCKALDYFRDEVKKASFPGLHIQWNQGDDSLMSEENANQFWNAVKKMRFNSVVMFNMGGLVKDYIVYVTNSIKIREQLDSLLNVPLFPCVSFGWDDTPSFPSKGIKDVVRLKALQHFSGKQNNMQIATLNSQD